MTMLSIINQIDVYLSRLCLARSILAKTVPDLPAKRNEKKPPSKKTRTVASTKAQRQASSRSDVRRSPRSGAQKRVVPVAHIPDSPTTHAEDIASLSGLLSMTVPENLALSNANTQRPLPDVNIERLPYRGPRESARPSRARSPKVSEPTQGTGALVGSVNSKIVVVSPEQARRERERPAQPEIQPRTVFKSGLTGRLAFESLFKDTSDRSN